MAIRFLLVTLVAGMGLDLPSHEDVSSLMKSGRIWIAARMDDWSVTTVRRAQEANDRAFAQIVDTMSRDFTSDLARMEAKKLETQLAKKTFEPIAVPDNFEPDFVAQLIASSTSPDDRIEVADSIELSVIDKLNLMNQGHSIPEEKLATVQVPEPPATAAPVTAQIASAKVETESNRTQRLASAIRLTRDAMGAWASLIHGTDAIVRR